MEKHNILKEYEIQNIESRLVIEKNLVKQIYFDASDIIRMIQGITSYDTGIFLDFEKFKYSRNTLLHGFASRKWLGEIKMLKPHQDEFIYKITNSDDLFPKQNKYKKEDIENDFLYKLIGDPREFINKAKGEFKYYVGQLKNNSEVIFKSNHIINPIYWYERYKKYILEDKIIILSKDKVDIFTYKKSRIFKKIYDLLEKKRPEVTFKFNNLMDALAISQLQTLVDEFNEKPFDVPLPIFYVSTEKLMECLEEIFRNDETLLSYSYENRYYQVFRNDLFFKIDKIFNLKNEEFKNIPIIDLASIKEKLSNIIICYSNTKIDFEESLEKLLTKNIEIEFFEKIWLNNKAYSEISESIRSFVNYKEKYNGEVRKIVEEEKEKIKLEFKSEINLSSILKKIVFDLSMVEKEAYYIIGRYNQEIDPFRDFGLTRFSFSDEACKMIRDMCKKIFDYVIDKNNEERKLEYSNLIFQLVDYLMNGVTNPGRINDLTPGLAILWVFGKYKTISLIGKYYDEILANEKIDIFGLNTFYTIYVSALIFSNNNLSKDDFRLINKYNKIIKGNNYKFKISKSFVLFQLWDRFVNYVSVPEKATDVQKRKMIKYRDIINTSLSYVKQSINYLLDKDIEKYPYRKTKYYYLLNNYIYYCTKGGYQKDFNSKNTENYVRELIDSKVSQAIWQYRFYDTIAWYYYRKAEISFKKRSFSNANYFIEKAKENNIRSLKGVKTNREKTNYQKLTYYIDNFMFEISKIKVNKIKK